jgi:wyosine [tRNA(Phe)-imidazoG37] synthetase (radical SAM superfamily)
VNRPHPSLRLEQIIAGLEEFRKEYRGRIWLEVMLVKGINDSPADIKALKEAVARIRPDKVQLNTVVRPPTEEWARPLTRKELKDIRDELDGRAEIIAHFKERRRPSSRENLEDALLSMIRRRPVTLRELASALGRDKAEILAQLNILLAQKKIQQKKHRKISYYEWG